MTCMLPCVTCRALLPHLPSSSSMSVCPSATVKSATFKFWESSPSTASFGISSWSRAGSSTLRTSKPTTKSAYHPKNGRGAVRLAGGRRGQGAQAQRSAIHHRGHIQRAGGHLRAIGSSRLHHGYSLYRKSLLHRNHECQADLFLSS